MNSLTVRAETDEAGELYGGKKASDLQSNVVVSGNKITGTLNFIEGGLAESGPLAGDGYFLALRWNDPAENITSLKIGLVPSASNMAQVEAIDDTDRNGVFKITDTSQKILFTLSDGENTKVQTFDISGLKFKL